MIFERPRPRGRLRGERKRSHGIAAAARPHVTFPQPAGLGPATDHRVRRRGILPQTRVTCGRETVPRIEIAVVEAG